MTSELSFGDWLKRRRRGMGLTQRGLAYQIGYAEVTLRKIEADELRPSLQMAGKLADVLQIAPEERLQFIRYARDEPNWQEVTLPTQTVSLTRPATPTNLPLSVISCIGRAKEQEQLHSLLCREDIRLLTLTGVGGTGKTRLALEVGTQMASAFRDGVFLIDLAPLRHPGRISEVMAAALGVEEVPHQSLVESLKHRLREAQTLLLVDNFEHVLAGAPLLAELLAAAAQIKILVTSRAPLHLYGEYEFPVPPLPLPDLQRMPPLAVLAQIPAMTLFLQRAQASMSSFELTADNALAVATLCVRLDGLPLAIELAAARTKLFSPSAMLARLTTSFQWLTGGAHDLPARQQTMYQAIAWSYQLLDVEEQALFARLSVFRNGSSLEAALAVCATGLNLSIVDGIMSLLDKSVLVRQEDVDGEPRVRMLYTLQAFAQERLSERSEERETQRRHAFYYLEFTETAEAEFRGARQVWWLAQLDQEYDNLRMALSWCVEQGETIPGLRLAAALGWYWELRGHFQEGQSWLATLLAQNPPEGHTLLAKALNVAGRLALRQGNLHAAKMQLESSLALSQTLADRRLQVQVLHNLGNTAGTLSDYWSSQKYHTEGFQIAQDIGDKWGMAWSHMGQGHVALYHKDYVRAQRHFAQSLMLRRELQDAWGIARSLNELGDVARHQGHFAVAQAQYEESLTTHRQLGHKGFLALVLHNLADVVCRQGHYEQAYTLLSESLALFQVQGRKLGMGWCMVKLAQIARFQGELALAVRLLAAATETFESTGYRTDSVESAQLTESVSTLQAQLGDTAFATAWALGRNLPIEQTVAQAHRMGSSLTGAEGTLPLDDYSKDV